MVSAEKGKATHSSILRQRGLWATVQRIGKEARHNWNSLAEYFIDAWYMNYSDFSKLGWRVTKPQIPVTLILTSIQITWVTSVHQTVVHGSVFRSAPLSSQRLRLKHLWHSHVVKLSVARNRLNNVSKESLEVTHFTSIHLVLVPKWVSSAGWINILPTRSHCKSLEKSKTEPNVTKLTTLNNVS